MIITIPGEFTTLNQYIDAERSNKFYGAKIKREETERVAEECLPYKVRARRNFKGIKSFKFVFNWHRKNKRTEKDNVSFAKKFILDGLIVGGIIPDDRWDNVDSFEDHFFIDSNRPRTEIEIIPVNT